MLACPVRRDFDLAQSLPQKLPDDVMRRSEDFVNID